MLGRVVVENGVKKIVPLTADCGSGNPVGTVIAVYSNKVPNGYLPCNGVAFDTAQFPVLYALLGDNHTPDLRECTLKGIGESGRIVGAHVKAGGLAVGEFIDDRVQTNAGDTPIVIKADQYSLGEGSVKITAGDNIPAGSAQTTIRGGATTEVKAVGVNWCIKATSGINENQADSIMGIIRSSMQASEVGGSGKYISAISETDGVISATESDLVTMITSSVDLNTMVQVGVYATATDAIGNGCSNIPVSTPYTFFLNVSKSTNLTTLQVFTDSYGGRYIRTSFNGGQTWNAWKKVIIGDIRTGSITGGSSNNDDWYATFDTPFSDSNYFVICTPCSSGGGGYCPVGWYTVARGASGFRLFCNGYAPNDGFDYIAFHN